MRFLLLAREIQSECSLPWGSGTKKSAYSSMNCCNPDGWRPVGQLSAEVVHEIRNPLNSISLNIDWLENELGKTDLEISKTLRSISREIERLHQITESYLVRARVPSQENQRTKVNELLREILEFSQEEDKTRNIIVETQLADDEILVRTDRSKLKQAFLNVIKNAREAMPRGEARGVLGN